MKRLLVVLDFDGLLVNAYDLIRTTFAGFDLDVGDETRFRNRRKFLKYLGGGKELLGNLANFALPKKRRLREELTRVYLARGRVHEPFVGYVNACIRAPQVHVGVVSRNFTLNPGATIRHVLAVSGIDDGDLDFVVPLPVGAKKFNVLDGMVSSRYRARLLAGDEIGDYKAAVATGYTPLIASYGFDGAERLRVHGDVPPAALFDTPAALAARLWTLSALYLDEPMPAGLGDRTTPQATPLTLVAGTVRPAHSSAQMPAPIS
ncbi:MAG: HAD family hydrolase [Gammaproteobacteria bacterium]|nr:HAD family hydrolase [Gammaproteobacteria bacterium]